MKLNKAKIPKKTLIILLVASFLVIAAIIGALFYVFALEYVYSTDSDCCPVCGSKGEYHQKAATCASVAHSWYVCVQADTLSGYGAHHPDDGGNLSSWGHTYGTTKDSNNHEGPIYNLGTAVKKDSSSHYTKYCDACRWYTAYSNHTFDDGKISDDGTKKIYTCTACGYQKEEDYHKHTPGSWVETKEATCVAKGAHKRMICTDSTCSEYGKYESEETKIDPNNHDYPDTWTTETAATCTEAGSKKRVCRRDSSHVETETIPIDSSNHTGKSSYSGKAPTCTEPGYYAGWDCSACGASGGGGYREKLGHAWYDKVDDHVNHWCSNDETHYAPHVDVDNKPGYCDVCNRTMFAFTISGENETWTNRNTGVTLIVEVTVGQAYDGDAYSFDNGATWQSSNKKTFTGNISVDTVIVKVKNVNGTEFLQTANVYYDHVAPTFTITGNVLANDEYAPSRTVTIENPDDQTPGSGLADEPFSFDGGNSNSWVPASTLSKTWDTGEHSKYNIVVRDKAGNWATMEAYVNVDAVKPTVTISGDGGTWVKSREITITASDNLALADKPYSYTPKEHKVNNTEITDRNTIFYKEPNTVKFVDLIVKDRAGNEYTQTLNMYVDNTAPIITKIDGESTTWAKSRTITITADDEKRAGLHAEAYSFDGGKTWQESNKFTYNKTNCAKLGIDATFKTIKVCVRDKLGNTRKQTINVYLDNTSPVITDIDGTSVTWAKSRTITITANDEERAGLHAEAYSFDGGVHWQNTNKFTYDENSCKEHGLPISFTTITVYVKDKLGNKTEREIDVYLDNTAPVATEIAGQGVDWVKSRTITITANDENRVGLADNPYSFDGGNTWQPEKTFTYDENSCKEHGLPISFTTTTVCIKDKLGNINPQTIDVYLDNTPPIANITGGSTTWARSRTITIAADDENRSGIHSVAAYSFDGGNTWQSGNTFTYDATSCTAKGLPVSFKTIEVHTKDNLGNTNIQTIDIYIDNTVPNVVITKENTHWTNDPVTITLSATDAHVDDGHSERIEYSYDNGATWTANANSITIDSTIKTLVVKIRDTLHNTTEKIVNVYEDSTIPHVSYKIYDGRFTKPVPEGTPKSDMSKYWKERTIVLEISEPVITTQFPNPSSTEQAGFPPETGYITDYAISYDGGQTWTQDEYLVVDWDTEKLDVWVRDKVGNTWKEGVDNPYHDPGIYPEPTPNPDPDPVVPPVVIKVDTLPPIFNVIGEGTDWVHSRTLAIVEATDQGPAGLDEYPFSFDGGQTWQKYDDNEHTFDETTTIRTTDIIVRDSAGNWSPVYVANVYTDNTAPSFALEGESTIWAKERTITVVNIRDDHSGFGFYTYSYDGGQTWTPNNTHTYRDTIITSPIMVRDAIDNRATLIANIYTDNLGPTFTASRSGEEGHKRTITIENPNDAHSGLNNYAYSFDNGATWTDKLSREFDIDIGQVTLKVRDKLNNETVLVFDVDVHPEPPVIKVVGQSTVWAKTRTLTVEAVDKKDDISGLVFSFDGGQSWQISTSHIFSVAVIYTTTVIARNHYGNTQSVEANVYIDNNPPTLTYEYGALSHDGTAISTILYGRDDESSVAYCHDYDQYNEANNEWTSSPNALIRLDSQTVVAVKDEAGNITTEVLEPSNKNVKDDGTKYPIFDESNLAFDGYIFGGLDTSKYLNATGTQMSYETRNVNGTPVTGVFLSMDVTLHGGYATGYIRLQNHTYPIYWNADYTETSVTTTGNEVKKAYVYIDGANFVASEKNALLTFSIDEYDSASSTTPKIHKNAFARVGVDVNGPIIDISFNTTSSRLTISAKDAIAGVQQVRYRFQKSDGSYTAWATYTGAVTVPLNTKYAEVKATDRVNNESSTTSTNLMSFTDSEDRMKVPGVDDLNALDWYRTPWFDYVIIGNK